MTDVTPTPPRVGATFNKEDHQMRPATRYFAHFVGTLMAFLIAGTALGQSAAAAPAADPQRLLSGDLKRKIVSDQRARCNDGTRATLYLRRNLSSKRWIVSLPGGEACTCRSCPSGGTPLCSPGVCSSCGVYLSPHAKPAGCGRYDPTPGTPDCTQPQPVQREKALLSSSCQADTRRGAGLLSPDREINPDFHEANAVWLSYCSSDYWIGNVPAEEQPEGIYFVGQTNLFASLEDLIGLYGMAEAKQVLVVGNAASGAMALLWHGDRIAKFIHDHIRHPVDVKLVADSAWLLNQDTYPAFEGDCLETDPISCLLAQTLMTAVDVYRPEIPADCAAEGYSWQCLLADVRVPMIETPMFHAQYLYDIGQLGIASFPAATATDSDWRWALSTVARPFRERLKRQDGAFAVSCYQHGFMTLDAWLEVEVTSGDEQVNVSEALLRWLEGQQDQPVIFIDDCEDEGCNDTCKACTYPPDPT